MKANFSGYATKAGLKCSDGRTITPEAFKHMDGMKVPLVWQHARNIPDNVLGHVLLEARGDGMYCYAFFNRTPSGKNAQALVEHDDIKSLSIYANNLVEKSKTVLHGMIREVSLVLSGANPGALIDFVNVVHSDGSEQVLEDEAVIYTGLAISHEEADDDSEESGETLADVYETLNEKQKALVNHMVEVAAKADPEDVEAEHSGDDDDDADDDESEEESTDENTDEDDLEHQEGNEDMTRNVFEQNGSTATKTRATLSHSEITAIVEEAQRVGSFKEAFLAHADELTAKYGIETIDLLFPDAKAISNSPEIISRRMEWVNKVLGGAHKTPFSRIKSLSTDITHEEARARGYIKGNFKKEEWFKLEKRVTTPTTIYKKQKLDRDDIIDITDLDVVAWLKAEMRLMLDEECARAVLVGDGREVDDEDKINEEMIRPIAHDDDFYTHKLVVSSNVSPEAFIETILRARKKYRGSGNPTMFTTEDFLTDLLFIKDRMGRHIYETEAQLAAKLRVSSIETVDVMDGTQVNGGELLAVLVNMRDYTIGADAGGKISMFDDFDIDYNQYKYLMEGRFSGALTKFKSAIAVTREGGTSASPTVPTFDPATGIVTIPNVTGVEYRNAETAAVLSAGAQNALAVGATLYVEAVPTEGYYFDHNTDADWEFTRPAA